MNFARLVGILELLLSYLVVSAHNMNPHQSEVEALVIAATLLMHGLYLTVRGRFLSQQR